MHHPPADQAVTVPTFQDNDRIPGLDGLRAISIGCVIALHISQRFGGSRWVQFFTPDGVSVFFVISGFIITTLLLREYENSGTIGLGEFYLRRAFRILPPIYVYLIFLPVYAHFSLLRMPFSSWLSSALFVRNYSQAPYVGVLSHTWSLAVEEQFYLFWPPLLLYVLTRRGRAGAARLAVFLIAISPLLRIATKLAGLKIFANRETVMLHTRLDILMFGCLAALAAGTPLLERIYQAAARYWWALALEFCVLTNLLARRFGHTYTHVIGMTVDGAAIALFLIWCTRNPGHPVGRFLNARPVVWIGWLSYSIYIWQTFFINVAGPVTMLPLILAVSCGSWYLIEKPARRLRNRVLRRMHDSEPAEPILR